jgi:hypothetical protein
MRRAARSLTVTVDRHNLLRPGDRTDCHGITPIVKCGKCKVNLRD